MANVPNVPGVPRLSSFNLDPPLLLIADAINVINLVLPARWGVFLKGVPVIFPASVASQLLSSTLAPLQSLASLFGAPNIIPVSASTIEFEFAQEFPLSDYPQEEGAFQSYNKVTLPFDVKVKVASGGPPSARQAFIETCLGIANSISLFDIVTPERVFASCNCSHIDWPRKARSGVSLIAIDLWFKQIAVSSTATFQNTRQPSEAGQQSVGNVQPQEPSLPVQNTVGNTVNANNGGW